MSEAPDYAAAERWAFEPAPLEDALRGSPGTWRRVRELPWPSEAMRAAIEGYTADHAAQVRELQAEVERLRRVEAALRQIADRVREVERENESLRLRAELAEGELKEILEARDLERGDARWHAP